LEWQALSIVDLPRRQMIQEHGAKEHYGRAHDLVRRMFGEYSPDRDRREPELEDVAERVAIALQTSRHKLIRAAPEGVACICAQYDDSDHGVEAAELWRDHLIAAARAAVLADPAGPPEP